MVAMRSGKKLIAAVLLGIAVILRFTAPGQAAGVSDGFSLQVTPSPLIETIKPGEQTTLDLKVRNANTAPEDLKMELKSFTIDQTSGDVEISDEVPSEVKDFVSFEEPNFHINAGEWYTQKVHVDTPKDAGFSYSFVILISRQQPAQKVEGVSTIEGSVAVFTLLNVNRPDAVKKLELGSFVSVKKSYEYVPAEFELSVKNSGNTIAQPKGNIFIGRDSDEQEPMAALEINPNNGYIIPKTSRNLSVKWNDGFPNRDDKGRLIWDWSKLNKLRIGKYTAHVVLIYDDGERDIPIESTVSFWVLPWKLISAAVLILALIIIGLFTTFKKSFGVIGAKKRKRSTKTSKPIKSEKTEKSDKPDKTEA